LGGERERGEVPGIFLKEKKERKGEDAEQDERERAAEERQQRGHVVNEERGRNEGLIILQSEPPRCGYQCFVRFHVSSLRVSYNFQPI